MNWLGQKPSEEEHLKAEPRGFDDFDICLGDLMRGERATLGKSLLDVQRELHIRATYAAAIENGDLSAFEAPSFVAGYVRSYARYLGMDPEWAYRKFCAETGFTVVHGMAKGTSSAERAPNPTRATPPDGLLSRVSFVPEPLPLWQRIDPGALGSMAVLLALVAGLGFGGWTVLQEVQRVQLAPADQAPTVVADLDPVSPGAGAGADFADELSVIAGTSGATTEGFVRVYRPQALDIPVMTSRDGPIAAINPNSTRASDDTDAESGTAQLALNFEGTETGTPDEGNTPVQVVEAGPPKVELLAVRPSWVRVRAADGTVLFEKILDAGERYEVPTAEVPATLRAGNSGGVYFLVNGEAYGPAAPGAQVVSNLALSAEALQERFELADLSGDADLTRFVAVAEAGSD